jgi:hybrid cluster-associated redox disulfide protein
MRFNKHMSIFEALATHEAVREVFESHGMSCCLCIGAQSESIEAGAILHKVDPDVVVAQLNALPATHE